MQIDIVSIVNILNPVAHFFDVLNQTPSIGLIILLVAVFAELVLAISVLRSNAKSATNVIFFLLSAFTVLWLVAAYIVRVPQLYPYAPLLARLGIFFAAPMSFLFFLLAHTIPDVRLRLTPRLFWSLTAGTALMMALNISPYAFTDATQIVNGAISPVAGWGLIPFSVLSTIFSIVALYFLVRKFRSAVAGERDQLKLVLIGMLILLILLIFTILIPILAFSSGIFVVLTPAYTLIFLGMTAYAIVRYGLFDIKVIATEALTAVICITLFSNIFVASTFAGRMVDSLVFLATAVLGVMLVRSVLQEVRHREELARLNEKIESTNKELEQLSRFKSELLSLASHQLRSPLAAIKGFASLIADGTYGVIEPRAKEALMKIQRSADELIGLINTLLDIRKVEEGRMDYKFATTRIDAMAHDVVELLRPLAELKHLELTFTSPGVSLIVNADAEKLKQVIQNLVDNALKYTPTGFVHVTLTSADGRATLSVADSGLGVPATLLPQLFEEYVRDERVKKQIRGTGLGLYIARKITEAHGGTIAATSPGEGKGSTFSFSLPLVPTPPEKSDK